MKYALKENGKILRRSGNFQRLLNYTAKTKTAVISFGNTVVWVQNPYDFLMSR